MADKILKATIVVDDQASKPLRNLEQGTESMTKSIVKAGLAMKALSIAQDAIARGFEEIKKTAFAAARIEELGFALQSIGKATNISGAEIDKTVVSLQDLNIAQREAMEATALFIQNELKLTDATKLARAAQDLAVIGMTDSSEAFRTLTQAIASQEPMLARNFGIVFNLNDLYEDYGKQLGLVTEETTKAGKTQAIWSRELTETEKKQAFLNKLLSESSKVAGTYEAAMESAGKRMRSLQGRIIPDFQAAMGNLFLPIMAEAVDIASEFFTSFTSFLTENRTVIERWGKIAGDAIGGFVRLIADNKEIVISALLGISAGLIASLVPALISATSAAVALGVALGPLVAIGGMFGLFIGQIDKLSQSLTGFTLFEQLTAGADMLSQKLFGTVKETQAAIAGVSRDGLEMQIGFIDEQIEALGKSGRDQVDIAKKTTSDVGNQLDKEIRDFDRSMERRKKSFDEQMQGLVQSHLEKRDSLEEDLKDELANFEETMATRKSRFDEEMKSMEQRHADKVIDLKEKMTDENADFDQKMLDRRGSHDRTMSDLRLGHSRKVEDIIEQMEREKAKGSALDKDRLSDLKEKLAEEMADFAKSQARKETDFVRTTERAKEEHATQLEDLKVRLAEEETDHQTALDKKTALFEKETEKVKAEHEKRQLALKEELQAEIDILTAHQEEVGQFKDAVVESDIARLKRKFDEEQAEAQRQHGEKLADIQAKGAEQGAASASSFATSQREELEAQKDELQTQLETMGEDINNSLAAGVQQGGKDPWAMALFKNLQAAVEDPGEFGRQFKEGLLQRIIDPLVTSRTPPSPSGGGLGGGGGQAFQHGGIIPGPPNQAVPIIAHGGERITSKHGADVAGPVSNTATVNVFGNVSVRSEQDLDELATRISSMINRQGELARVGIGS